jgi:hypothetical protein
MYAQGEGRDERDEGAEVEDQMGEGAKARDLMGKQDRQVAGGIHEIMQSGGGSAHVERAIPSTDPVSTSFKRPWIRKIRVSKPKDSGGNGTHMRVCKPLREKSSCAPSD